MSRRTKKKGQRREGTSQGERHKKRNAAETKRMEGMPASEMMHEAESNLTQFQSVKVGVPARLSCGMTATIRCVVLLPILTTSASTLITMSVSSCAPMIDQKGGSVCFPVVYLPSIDSFITRPPYSTSGQASFHAHYT